MDGCGHEKENKKPGVSIFILIAIDCGIEKGPDCLLNYSETTDIIKWLANHFSGGKRGPHPIETKLLRISSVQS